MQLSRRSYSLQIVVALAGVWLTACGGSSRPISPLVRPTPFFITNTCTYVNQTVGGPLQICFYGLPNVVVGVPFSLGLLTDAGPINSSVPLQASNVKAPISFQLLPGTTLPPGLTFDPRGVVKGIPTQPGTFAFAIVGVDSSAPTPQVTSPARFTLHVLPAGALLRQVGQTNLGGVGQNADVSVFGSFAYVGTRGVPGSCPPQGVKIVRLADPTHPQLVASLPQLGSASYQPEAKVATVSAPGFTGDMLAVAVRPCDPATDNNPDDRGVALYDVTTPANPKFLAFWQSGVAGVGDVAIVPRTDAASPANSKTYVLAAVPGSELADPSHQGALRVLDVTRPTTPVQVAQWGIFKALNIDPNSVKVGQDQRVFLDTITLSSDTTKAFLSFWDEGVVIMDVSRPAAIADSTPNLVLSQITYPTLIAGTPDNFSSPEGNTHQALAVAGDTGLMIADKVCASQKIPNPANPSSTISANPATTVVCGTDVDLTATTGWGFLRTYALPSFSTPQAEGSVVLSTGESDPPPDNGIYTPNSLAWNGNNQDPHGYVAWFSNGVVDLDLSGLTAPAVLGAFVPPATSDPQGSNPNVNNPAQPLVYGVASFHQGGNQYIVASDINSGLWVLQETSAPQFAILTTSLPVGTTLVPYSAQLIAANGTAPVQWSLASGSSPTPPGLTLNADGSFTGTPAANSAGTYTFTVQAANVNGGSQIVTQQFSIVVNSNFAITTTTLPVATLNEPYSQALQAVNGSGALTWRLQSGSLPAGMNLSSTGSITGTPSTAGTSTFTVAVNDSSNPPQTTSETLTLQVEPFSFSSPPTLAAGGIGQAYSGGLALANGTSPFRFSVTNGSLPPGLVLAADTGTLGGTPTSAGTFVFTVQVSDGDGQTTSGQFSLTIAPFAIATTSLPTATVGQGYLAPIQVSNGLAPYTFTLSAGNLPAGLSLSAANSAGAPGAASGSSGAIAGVPTAPGTSTFTVQVRDSNGNLASLPYTLTVQP